MNILFTNNILDSRTGTETFVRDLAAKLYSLGHYPMIYSPRIGCVGDEIKNAGIPVVSDLKDIPRKPDIIHGHHHIETVSAFIDFPAVPGIYVCHDRLSPYDTPPLYKRIYFYVAVDHNCCERLVNSGISDKRIKVVYNSVDIDKFLPRLPLPIQPKRALVFSNYASRSNYLQPIINACRKLNIELDIIGAASQKMSEQPEKILKSYDLIFAKARCAIEAMATGAAVILCDYSGLGPMVTFDEVAKLREWNFGMRCLTQPIKEENIIKQISRYNPDDAKSVADYIREKSALSNMTTEYLNIYNEVIHLARDNKTKIQDEFEEYINSLSMQAKNSDSILSQHKSQQLKWAIQSYLMLIKQLVYEPKKIWRVIIKRYKRLISGKISKSSVLFDTKLVFDSKLCERVKNIDKMLFKISMAERLILKYGSR